MSTGYIARADKETKSYLAVYAAWIDSMTPEEKRDLVKLGLDRPLHPHTVSGALPASTVITSNGLGATSEDSEDDAPEALHPDQWQASMDHAAEELDQQETDYLKLGEAIRALLGLILASSNARLTVECVALVTGILYEGISEAEIAKKHGITRSAVSKRCVEIAEALGLDPSRAMRGVEVRERCAAAQTARKAA
ncbi:hypothetical protein [Verrucomicrobium sp. BvORR106]|uniref:hypothetical protein n=1 Tax=Verrucomicrobium sp. BvORR106 TaxID=1403819 RepID=UPI00056F3761|nr:hypothetical protein [Verrucomicrobium sp. BvORR106]